MENDKHNYTVLEAKGLKKIYNEDMPNETRAVDGIDMKVNKGDFISIMGPSGSGKTTLLDLMGTLMRPTYGSVLIDGIETEDLEDNELAVIRGEKIGFIFQQYNLIPSITAAENVEISLRIMNKPKSEARERSQELLKMVGLSHRISNRPTQLSGGEQQRVAIARALANDPKIILGDEPTGNLDTKTSKKILELLKYLNTKKGYTIVVVTHDPSVTKYTDKTIHMRDGKILKEVVNNEKK